MTSQWLDGSILVAPVLTQDSQKNVYLPSGTWFELNTTTTHQGPTTLQGSVDLDIIPMYVRPGAVIPLAPVVQYTDALPGGALEVQIYAGQDGTFTLVEDDGETTAYEKGLVRQTKFSWSDTSKTLSWASSDHTNGSAKNLFTRVFATLFSASDSAKKVSSTVDLGSNGSIGF